jgi:hypothetical protein
MLNPIRPTALTSLLAKDEVKNRSRSEELRQLGDSVGGETVSTPGRELRVIGGGMAGRHGDVNQGSRSGNSDEVHDLFSRFEESCPEGDRAFVGATKRGNAHGAKEGRDVEAEEQELRPRKTGVVPARAVRARDRVPPESSSNVCLPLDERRRTKAALSDNVFIQRSDGRFARTESVHRLESRMREIRLSGSGGGAASRIAAPTSFSRGKER